jgi:hypothetical protein
MTRLLARVALFVFAVTMSLNAFAGSKSESITLMHDVQVNGTTLHAGDYTVKYDANGSTCLVKMVKNGKTVATANGELKQLANKPAHTQIVLDESTGDVPALSEMDFSNSTTAITFSPSVATASGK